jgi:exosortase A
MTPAIAAPAAVAAAWRLAGFLLAGVLVLWLLAFHRALWSMVDIWLRSDTFGHGFLIAPISLYLIWQRRHRLARQLPAAAPWALGAVAGAALLWLVGHLADVLVVQEFAALFVLQSAVLAVLGWRIFLTLIFPLAYLLLMVPFGEFLTNPLQDVTAFFVVNALRIIGIPVFSDGVFLQIPNGRFTVAEACAGLRFLTATVALGLLFASEAYRDWRRRGIFMVLVFVIPIVANGFRALGIVLLAHYTNNQVAVEADHVIYGWVFLTFVTLALLGAGMALRPKTPPPEPEIPSSAVPPRPKRLIASGVAASLLVVAGPALAALLQPAAMPPGFTARLELPPVSAPWSAAEGIGDWAPSFQGASGEIQRRYADGSRSVDLFVAFYAQQTQDAEVVNPKNRIAQDEEWARTGGQTVSIDLGGRPLELTATRIVASGGRQRLVVMWYWVGGRMVADPLQAKLLQLWGLASGRPAAAAMLLSAEDPEGRGRGLETLRSFLASLPPLDAMLDQADGSVPR